MFYLKGHITPYFLTSKFNPRGLINLKLKLLKGDISLKIFKTFFRRQLLKNESPMAQDILLSK